MTPIQCPHIAIGELAKMWKTTPRSVQRWLSDDGIVPVRRGRYRISDIERYAEKNGRAKLTKMESYELAIVKKENETLKAELEAEKKRRLEILSLAASDLARVIVN